MLAKFSRYTVYKRVVTIMGALFFSAYGPQAELWDIRHGASPSEPHSTSLVEQFLCSYVHTYVRLSSMPHVQALPGIHCSRMRENLRKNISKRIRESYGKV